MFKKLFSYIFIVLLFFLSYPTVIDLYHSYIVKDIDYANDHNRTLESGTVDCQSLFTQDIGRLISYTNDLGYKITFGEASRTKYQQRHNMIIGVSQTMNSNHLRRRAVDFNLYSSEGRYLDSKEDYRDIGDYWENLDPNNVWGGSWTSINDPYHFERRTCNK